MDDYRTIVLLIAFLLIAGIVLDGVRRSRRDKRNNLSMNLRDEVAEPADQFNGELPAGGARVVKVGGKKTTPGIRLKSDMQEFDGMEPFGSADGVIETNEPVVRTQSTASKAPQTVKPVRKADKPKKRMRISAGASGGYEAVGADASHSSSAAQSDDSGPLFAGSTRASTSTVAQSPSESVAAPVESIEPMEQPAPKKKERLPSKYGSRYSRGRRDSAEVARGEQSAAFDQPAQPSKMIVLKVIAGRGKVFDGERLLRCMVSCGLRFSQQEQLFYRHEQHNGKGQKLFGLANLSQTGQFDYATMRTLRTPGVCLYLSLPGPRRSQNALELMVDTARRLAAQLGGDMMDENNSVVTGQTVEHFRQQVIEFERVAMQQRNELA